MATLWDGKRCFHLHAVASEVQSIILSCIINVTVKYRAVSQVNPVNGICDQQMLTPVCLSARFVESVHCIWNLNDSFFFFARRKRLSCQQSWRRKWLFRAFIKSSFLIPAFKIFLEVFFSYKIKVSWNTHAHKVTDWICYCCSVKIENPRQQ